MAQHTWWGADCASSFQSRAESCHTAYGYLPTFVGRYLAEYVPTPAELEWLHKNLIAVLLIWNGASPGDVAQDSFLAGQQHGYRAAAAAKTIGYPPGRYIPVDIEASWTPTASWLAGYIDACHQKGYVGGAYMNVLDNAHVQAWIGARRLTPWPAYIYSSEPELDHWRGTVLEQWYDFSFTGLGADHGKDVIIHQYSENELGATIDLDIATDLGHSLLWLPADPTPPKPKPPVRKMTTQACALKPTPDHLSKPLAAISRGGQLLDTGRRDGEWAYVQYTDLYGWVPAAVLTDLVIPHG